METKPPETPSLESPPLRRVNWLLLLAFLIGPAALAFIGAIVKVDFIAVASPLLGGAIGGIICGVMLGRRFGRTTLSKVVLGISCAVVFGCLSLFIAFVGCATGGFQLDVR